MSSGSVPDSSETAALGAGNYSYQATYAGDTSYAGATGDCEPFTINQAATSTATIVKDHANSVIDSGSHPAALGSKAHDTATVGSLNTSFVVGGNVSYQRYSGLDCQSANKIGSAEVKAMSSGSVPDS